MLNVNFYRSDIKITCCLADNTAGMKPSGCPGPCFIFEAILTHLCTKADILSLLRLGQYILACM